MTTNRLAKADQTFVGKLSAADFASIARENGKGDLARAWQRVADERGEERIADNIRVSFNEAKEKIYVPVKGIRQ